MFDLDMNRVFPGDNNGAMAEYVAAGIIEDIIGSDLCIDIHSSNIFVNEMPQVRINDDTQEKLLPYAKMMNAQFVWIYSSITVLDATLAYSLNHLGVPTLVTEMGVGNRITPKYCRDIVDGIFNLCRIWEYGMMSQRMLMTRLSLQKVKLHFLLLRKAEYSYQQLILWEGLELERI